MSNCIRQTYGECARTLSNVPFSIFLLSLAASLIGVLVLAYGLIFTVAFRPRPPFPEEKKYRTLAKDGTLIGPTELPCWQDNWHRQHLERPKQDSKKIKIDESELFMSVVVPAYNEEDRLLGMLEETVDYLEHAYGNLAAHKNGQPKENMRQRKTQTEIMSNGQSSTGWEILLVSDGSTDRTEELAFEFARDHQLSLHPRGHSGPWSPERQEGVRIPPGSIRIVTLAQNRGKGGAVTHGMRHARGKYVVFADADGASKFSDLGKLVKACQDVEDSEGRGVAVGSRAHMVGSEAVVKRSKLRNFLMHSFHLILRLLTPPATAKIKDTQCGFKLFSRASLPYIIPYMHSEGWIFDVEMLMLAEFANIPVAEVAIGWHEVKGSKLNVLWDSIGMAWGLFVLRASWGMGIYRRT